MPRSLGNAYRLALAALLAAVAVAIGVAAYLARDLPAHSVEPRQFDPADLDVVMGTAKTIDRQLVIESFSNGHALLSSGRISVNAEDYPFLTLTLIAPAETSGPTLFWRRSEAPDQLLQWRVRETGTFPADLSSAPGWNGEISEIGLLLGAVEGETLRVGAIVLEPDSLALRLRILWDGWTAFEHWTQKSINFLRGGGSNQAIPLPVVLLAWLSLSLLLFWALTRFSRHLKLQDILVTGLALFLAAWMMLDLRWTANGLQQARSTIADYWGVREEQRLGKGLDGELYRYLQGVKAATLPDHPTRILVLGDEQFVEYFLQRATYHLLPHSAEASRRIPEGLSPDGLDYILYFGVPGGLREVAGWNPEWQTRVVRTQGSDWAEVYRVIR